jgi:hypothetical protein
MRTLSIIALLIGVPVALAADVESRVLTTYIPQDTLEKVVRSEGWTEIPLNVAGGVRAGDVIRVWAGGLIDRGNGDQPGENCNGPSGATGDLPDPQALALSTQPAHAYALLLKTDGPALYQPAPPGKPLEIKADQANARFWIGFNDSRGRYHDNHIGKGRRHEFDPLWVRIEVVRIVVD